MKSNITSSPLLKQLPSLSIDELNDVRTKIEKEISSRLTTSPMGDVSLSINAGNRRAGAKCWIKEPVALDPKRGDGWGIQGRFVSEADPFNNKDDTRNFSVGFKEGTVLVVGAVGGSYKNTTSRYAVLKVKSGAVLDSKAGYQRLKGNGVEELQMLQSRQQILDLYPELAKVKPEWFKAFAILRSSGVPLATMPSALLVEAGAKTGE